LPELKAKLAAQHEDLARRQIEVSAKLTDRLEKEADELPIRDVSTAQRNLDVGSGIHSDKAKDLRGDPSLIVERRSLQEIERRLGELGLLADNDAIDSEAVEVLPDRIEGGDDV
jgi:hypothetical protein